MCLLHPPLLPSQMLGSMWCHLLTLICKLVHVLNPAISKIKTEGNTGIHFSDKKVELACDRPWLPAFEPEEDSRAPGYTVHVTCHTGSHQEEPHEKHGRLRAYI